MGRVVKRSWRSGVTAVRLGLEAAMEPFADDPENLGAYRGPIRGKAWH